ncbi:hypothetical protein [Lacinutrix himadriensis]|uniref:hypothetical protein n=1 Tax=Lacinutrix himadriensis TaxID=641549 RepID=UPI0006E3B65E|nr:hypothetical protein [Lacinutrix himadriensis]
MLGISTYKPKFHTTAESFKSEFELTLSELIGKRIERFWIMWDTKENEWLTDGPIVLDIEEKRFEFTAYQLDEFSLTINSFELTDKLDWYGMGNEMPLIWKENGNSDLTKNLNKVIIGINILTYNFLSESVETGEKYETGDMLTGIEFVLEKESESDNENFFTIFNNLDQNGIEKTEINHENQIKRIKITGYNIA